MCNFITLLGDVKDGPELQSAGGCDGSAKAQAAATGALSAAKRSHPTSEVRSRSREDPMPEGRRPRGVTPSPRSGAAAESTRLRRRRNGREELPHVRGQGVQPRGDTPRPRSRAATRGVTPRPRSGAAAERRYPTPPSPRPGVAGGRSNPTPGQGRWPGGPTPHPRSCGCAGAGGPRGAIPC